MLGFTACANSGEIELLDRELEHADWFTPDDLADGAVIRLAPRVSISRRLIDDWYLQRTGKKLKVSGKLPNSR